MQYKDFHDNVFAVKKSIIYKTGIWNIPAS